MEKKDLSIFVLINRVRETTLTSLTSYVEALPQFEVTISYNGNSEEEFLLLSEFANENRMQFSTNNSLSFFEHFDYLRKKNCKDFVMFLHDDDIMLHGAGELIESLNPNTKQSFALAEAIQVGAIRKTAVVSSKNTEKVLDRFNVLIPYLFNRHMIAFPTWIYNARLLESLAIGSYKFGKHSDVQIASHMAENGVRYVSPVKFIYQIHTDQDSSVTDIEMKRASRRFLLKEIMRSFRFTSCFTLFFVALTVLKTRES